jgi:hypothetical protein
MKERGRLTRQPDRRIAGAKAALQDDRFDGANLGGIPSDRICSGIRTRPQGRRHGRPHGHRLERFAWSMAGRHQDSTKVGSMPVNSLRCG